MTTEGSSFDSGGAGCVGTVESYLKVLTVLINKGVGANGTRIISEATLDEMLKDQLSHLEKPLEKTIQAATPTFTNEIQMMPGVNKGWVSASSGAFNCCAAVGFGARRKRRRIDC